MAALMIAATELRGEEINAVSTVGKILGPDDYAATMFLGACISLFSVLLRMVR